MIIFGEKHLRHVLSEYAKHYHEERPHQGLGNRRIYPMPEPGSGTVTCRERLGGLLRYYHRSAA